MTNIVSLTLLCLLVAQMDASGGEKSSLKWKTYDEASTEAKKQGKKILVDVYTDWCGWCKRMDKDVYADSAVTDFLLDRYVIVKLNAESTDKLQYQGKAMSQIEFSRNFGVTGYPSTLFLNPNGDAITKLPGYVPADRFLNILRFIGDDHYLTMKWEEFSTLIAK